MKSSRRVWLVASSAANQASKRAARAHTRRAGRDRPMNQETPVGPSGDDEGEGRVHLGRLRLSQRQATSHTPFSTIALRNEKDHIQRKITVAVEM